MSTKPEIIVRRYQASSFDAALDLYEVDLPGLAEGGYVPVATVWGWDTADSVGWLVGGSSWKPGPGTLAVTYRRDGAAS